VQKKVVELRLQKMKSEGLIKGIKKIKLTDEGNAIIIKGKQKRMQKRSYDFHIDGIDFTPLNREFYTPKYLNSYFSENEYNYFTNTKGETKSSKPFKPNIVHKPLIKGIFVEEIFNIPETDRFKFAIPDGIENIENIDFTKMSIPLLVGLMIKNGKPIRKLIDGFSTIGDSEKLEPLKLKLEDKINNLELRLDTWKDKITEEPKFTFTSNWPEIDSINEEQQLQFISKEDLKIAFSKLYDINILSDKDLINNEYEIGVNVSKELLLEIKTNKRQFLKNVERGRDYQMFSTNSGIWLVFIVFRIECPFVESLLEIIIFLRNARDKQLNLNHITERLSNYSTYRQALVILEEYELLELIDINKYMYSSVYE